MANSTIHVSLQTLNATAFSKHKVFIYPENSFNIGAWTPFLFEGKIKRITSGINEQYGEAEIEFPSKKFGNHITWMTPFSTAIDSTDNTVFKGFFSDEDSVMDRSNDQISGIALDYKWFMGKLSKIRGKIYTVDNYIDPKPGFLFTNTRVYTNESMFEKYRYTVPGGEDNGTRTPNFQQNEATGFLGGVRTIFNENGDPDAACYDITSNQAIAFKFDPDDLFDHNLRVHERRGDKKYYWNYATMLMYIARYYVENYFQGFFGSTRVEMSRKSISDILHFGQSYGEQYIIPDHFEITGLSPTQAIDRIVKAIPGSWHWRLNYFKDIIIIEINNNYEAVYSSAQTKSLFIGTGGKINDESGNNVNVASIRARRSIRDSISHAVAVGGNVEIETTIQYLPGWKQYLRPTLDFSNDSSQWSNNYTEWDKKFTPNQYYVSNFQNRQDFNNWLKWSENVYAAGSGQRLKDVITTTDELRYSQIFRLFVFPKNKDQITKFPNINLGEILYCYKSYVNYLHELMFSNVIVPRDIKNPVTNYRRDAISLKDVNIDDKLSKSSRDQTKENQNPLFVFLYDDWGGDVAVKDGSDSNGSLTAAESARLNLNKWLIPSHSDDDSDLKKSLNHSFDSNNKAIIFDYPQYERQKVSERVGNESARPEFIMKYVDENYNIYNYGFTSRKVFVTCRVECDVPLVTDHIGNRAFYGNARMVSQDIVEKAKAVIRVNAYYPTPDGYQGDSLNYSDDNGEGNCGSITRSSGSQLSYGSKLVDWNRIEQNGPTASNGLIDAVLVVDNTNLLEQTILIMIGSVPLYTEEFSVDLGRVDASYKVGDRIDRIYGSEDDNGGGGYFNLKAFIERIEIVAQNDTDAYTTQMTILNNIPPTFPKMMERRI
jgi:hypothetical protein